MKLQEFFRQLRGLDRIPKFGIMLTGLFLLAFVALNVLVYIENQKRFQILEEMNRDGLLMHLTEVQINLNQLDKLIDDYSNLTDEEKSGLINHLDFLKEKVGNLQRGPLAVLAATTLAVQFEVINKEIKEVSEKIRTLEAMPSPAVQAELNECQQKLNKAFLQIELQAQHMFQERISVTLEHLRNEEHFIFVFGLTFVILGSLLLIFLVQDLFKRSEMLDKAHEAERMKSSFFAMMSHEIRTPINGILGTLRLLQDTGLDSGQRQLTHTAYQSAEGLLVIINDVLDYSKIEAGKLQLEVCDFRLRSLANAVMDLMKPLAQAKGLKLSTTVADDVPDGLHGDPVRIRQVMLNFLSNAVKFTETGFVHLDIRTTRVEQGGMSFTHVRFEVTDSGMGISNEVKAKLFKEFSQADGSYARKFEGTGLGLAICRRLVEMMGGFAGVISEIGKGSTFWFSFPIKLAQSAIEEDIRGPIETGAQKRTARILVAEDNPTNQMIAVAFLKKGGHETRVANNGLEAVEAIKKEAFDMVLMDISMPEMDGFAATKAIRALGGYCKDMPIIAMTAHAMRGDREACLQAGMNDYLTKPVNRDELLSAISRWMPKVSGPQAKDSGGFFAAHPEVQNMAVPTPSSAQRDDNPEINEALFMQIVNDLGRDNVSNFAGMFLDDLRNTGQEMLDAYGRHEWPQVKTHAHSLKSSAKSFGLVQLSALAQKIERQCKEEGKADAGLIDLWLPCVASATKALIARMEKEGLPKVS